MNDKIKIAVLIKQVNGEINPFDACALESALQIDNADITILSMGRRDVEPMLQNLTRLADIKAYLISDIKFAGADTLATAKTLKKAIDYAFGSELPDLIFCGRQSVDGDTAQVPPCLSRLTGYSLITNVMAVNSVTNDSISCNTRNGEMQSSYPCVVTFERINTLRLPSIRSKAKEVQIITNDELNIAKDECGLLGSPTRVLKTFENSKGKRHCKFISFDELDDIISCSLNQSENDIKIEQSEKKLPLIHVVGEELKPIAQPLANEVRVINKSDFDSIMSQINSEKPEFLLWDSGPFGRYYAPQAAALLNTGLCADCTMLETDGEDIFFYRPAASGSIMAKIKCLTTPKMATVRTISNAKSDVVISLGIGAIDSKDQLIEYANKHYYELAASRGAVDKNALPYSMQVGLTGKAISPKVYIACGISGAVHHVCAIENAGTVIAINSDKDARIFDYADYGIVGDIKNLN